MGLSLATVPLYLAWLGQERYGVMLTGLSFAGYLMFSDAGLSWSSMLLIAQANGRGDKKGLASIVRNSVSLATCSIILVAVLIALALTALTVTKLPWLPYHPEAPGLLIAVGCSVASTLILSPFYSIFNGMQEAHFLSLYQGSGRILGTLASLGVASSGASLGYVFGANVAGTFVVGLIAATHCLRKYSWMFARGPFWDSQQIKLQLRTGAKSFAMQIGSVLSGTAPVLAISSAAGPQYVPYLTIPLTLLNLPITMLSSFNANLQAGYGEAISKGETKWIADVVLRIFKQSLLLIGLLSAGFYLLAEPFITLWTSGRLDVSEGMLGSVWAIAVSGAFLSVFRFALSGMNRHRAASQSELICGILTVVLANLSVRYLGYQWVGLGILLSVLLTSGWILPRELSRALGNMRVLPSPLFFWRQLFVFSLSLVAGGLVMLFFSTSPVWQIIAIGPLTTLVYGVAAAKWLPEEWNRILPLFKRYLKR